MIQKLPRLDGQVDTQMVAKMIVSYVLANRETSKTKVLEDDVKHTLDLIVQDVKLKNK